MWHLKQVGYHCFDSLFIEVGEVERENILKEAGEKIENLKKIRNDFLKKCTEIIQNVNLAYIDFVKKISSEKKYL